MVIEEKSSLIEGVIGAVGIIIVLTSTLSAPRLNRHVSREELTAESTQKTQRIAALQTWLKTAQQGNETLRTQLADSRSLLEQARTQIDTLTAERDELKTQVASTNGQLKEIQGQLQDVKAEMAKVSEFLSLQDANKAREEAEERAKKAEERYRELTLKLSREGVMP